MGHILLRSYHREKILSLNPYWVIDDLNGAFPSPGGISGRTFYWVESLAFPNVICRVCSTCSFVKHLAFSKVKCRAFSFRKMFSITGTFFWSNCERAGGAQKLGSRERF